MGARCLWFRYYVPKFTRFFLDDSNVDPEIRDDRGDTPLNVAAFNGQFAAAEELCRRGANVNSKNNKVL